MEGRSSFPPPQDQVLQPAPSPALEETQRQLQLQIHAREVVLVAGESGALVTGIVKALLSRHDYNSHPTTHRTTPHYPHKKRTRGGSLTLAGTTHLLGARDCEYMRRGFSYHSGH